MDCTRLTCRLKTVPVALALSVTLLSSVSARELSITECKEGADYIRNAAISRDHGITEKKFMEIFETDMVMIQSVPKSLRWFVQDAEDEAFLRAQVGHVFQRPQSPQQHARDFAEACMLRTGAWDADDLKSI